MKPTKWTFLIQFLKKKKKLKIQPILAWISSYLSLEGSLKIKNIKVFFFFPEIHNQFFFFFEKELADGKKLLQLYGAFYPHRPPITPTENALENITELMKLIKSDTSNLNKDGDSFFFFSS